MTPGYQVCDVMLRTYQAVGGLTRSWVDARRRSQRGAWQRGGGARVPVVPAGQSPRASVVIVCSDQADDLDRALAAFHATLGYTDRDDLDAPYPVAFDDYELIVVDDASGDGSGDYLRRAVAKGWISKAILGGRHRGRAACVNLGFAHASPGSFACVALGADMIPATPGWLPRMLAVLARHPEVGGLSMTDAPRALLAAFAGTMIDYDEPVLEAAAWPSAGVGLAIPRRVLAQIGPFGEDGSAGRENIDYLSRLGRAGYQAYCLAGLRASRRPHRVSAVPVPGRRRPSGAKAAWIPDPSRPHAECRLAEDEPTIEIDEYLGPSR
jgi:GT2 family glycosyltransferase